MIYNMKLHTIEIQLILNQIQIRQIDETTAEIKF